MPYNRIEVVEGYINQNYEEAEKYDKKVEFINKQQLSSSESSGKVNRMYQNRLKGRKPTEAEKWCKNGEKW